MSRYRGRSRVWSSLDCDQSVTHSSAVEPHAKAMSCIYVCNLMEMAGHAEALKASHLVSLVSPDEQPATPACIALERHHRVGIHDISEPLDGHILPAQEHVDALIDFVRAW